MITLEIDVHYLLNVHLFGIKINAGFLSSPSADLPAVIGLFAQRQVTDCLELTGVTVTLCPAG